MLETKRKFVNDVQSVFSARFVKKRRGFPFYVKRVKVKTLRYFGFVVVVFNSVRAINRTLDFNVYRVDFNYVFRNGNGGET